MRGEPKSLTTAFYEFMTIGLIVLMVFVAVWGLYMIGKTVNMIRSYPDLVLRVEALERQVEKNESDVQAAWDDIMRMPPAKDDDGDETD